jgi:hypothetical protein
MQLKTSIKKQLLNFSVAFDHPTFVASLLTDIERNGKQTRNCKEKVFWMNEKHYVGRIDKECVRE